MQNFETELLKTIISWLENGKHICYLFTVAATTGASPRPVGSMMAYNSTDKLQIGSLSGGCIEEELINSINTGSLKIEMPIQLKYGVSAEENARLGLPCGGSMLILAERLSVNIHLNVLKKIVDAISNRVTCCRTVNFADGRNSFELLTLSSPFELNEQFIRQGFGPAFQLLLIGAGAIAQAIIYLSEPFDFVIRLCDPRKDFIRQWRELNCKINIENMMPDDFVYQYAKDEHTAILTLSHDPRVDDMALMAALESPAIYIGALGSSRTSVKRRERLTQLGLDGHSIARLHAPVGIDIGSKLPAEIAVSILADIIKARRLS